MNAHLQTPRQKHLKLVDFYGLEFYVNGDVLTPRPETEQLIDTVLDLCGKPFLPGVRPNPPKLNSKNLKILDVGTGSGCIAVTLKKFLPDADIYASDVSEIALKIAQKNARCLRNGRHIYVCMDFTDPFSTSRAGGGSCSGICLP